MVATAGLALVLALPGVAQAAPGDLDTSFSFDGKVTTDFGGVGDEAHAVAVQLDGRIVAAGRTRTDFALARYNVDGSLDTSFSGDGRVTTGFGTSETARGVALQADGKIVAAGHKNGDFALARYEGGSGARIG